MKKNALIVKRLLKVLPGQFFLKVALNAFLINVTILKNVGHHFYHDFEGLTIGCKTVVYFGKFLQSNHWLIKTLNIHH